MNYELKLDPKTGLYVLGAAAAATVLASTEAQAQTAPTDVTSAVTSISATMSALGGLAAAALAVVLVPFGISYALKFAKRVMSKG